MSHGRGGRRGLRECFWGQVSVGPDRRIVGSGGAITTGPEGGPKSGRREKRPRRRRVHVVAASRRSERIRASPAGWSIGALRSSAVRSYGRHDRFAGRAYIHELWRNQGKSGEIVEYWGSLEECIWVGNMKDIYQEITWQETLYFNR